MCEAGFWSFGSNWIESESVIRFMERITSYDSTFGSNQYRIESLWQKEKYFLNPHDQSYQLV